MMVVTPKDAFVSLWNIRHAQKAAQRKSPDNGVILLMWGSACLLGLTSFDIFTSLVAAFVLATIAMACASWQFFYKRRLPVQPTKLKTTVVVGVWTFYHICTICGGTIVVHHFLHLQFPYFFTLVGIVDAAPLLIMGGYLWKQSHA